jgi:hypothetical protein
MTGRHRWSRPATAAAGRLAIGLLLASLGSSCGAAGAPAAPPAKSGTELGFVLPPGLIDRAERPDGGMRAESFRVAAQAGERIRTAIKWSDVQPNCRLVRSGSFHWDRPDEIMRLFLEEDARQLLTLNGTPACAAARGNPSFEPRDRYLDAFRDFAREVLERYGPGGSFFDRHPELAGHCCPVDMIEIWNEPNLGKKWSRADPVAYARFFTRVAAAIRRAGNWTPRVAVVTGGVTGLNGGPWPTNGRDFVRGMYRVPGFRAAADRIGIHTYSPTAKTAMRALKAVRRIMAEHGHRVPIVISEHGWSTCPRPSAERSNGKCVSPRGQANRLKLYARKLLAERNRHLRVESLLWFMTQDAARRDAVAQCRTSPKNFYGFFDFWGAPKPAWSVWREITGATGPDRLSRSAHEFGCRGGLAGPRR